MSRFMIAMTHSHRVQRFVVGLLSIGFWSLSSSFAMAAQEETLKAAFVLNFLKFVEWPQQGPVDTNATLLVAVIGNDPIAPVLQKTLDGKSVQERKVAVRLFQNAAEWKSGDNSCQALFVTTAARSMWKEIHAVIANRSMLTISDSPEFCAGGGMLNLFEKDNRIRFEANLGAASGAGLKMRAEFLKLATIVSTTGEEK
jgi:hypothetical protein